MAHIPFSSAGNIGEVGAGIVWKNGQKVAKAKEEEKTSFTRMCAGGMVFTSSVISVKMANSQLQ